MRERILNYLIRYQGDCISGQELSERLNISRTAIWKHINNLQEQGFQIEAQSGKGYALREIPDLLYPELIRANLNTEYIGQEIRYFKETGSTNKVAKKLADDGFPEGTVVVTEKQNEGRGRLGRSWESPAQKGIWFSLILRPLIDPPTAPSITLLIAVAMARALKKGLAVNALIKWPNDLYLGEKKICGILTEMKADMDKIEYIIAGIGLNVNQKQEEFPEELQKQATSLREEMGRETSRLDIIRSFLQELEELYETYQKNGFVPIKQYWKEANMTLGRLVSVDTLDRVYQGTAVDITEDGGLIVDTPGGRMTFRAGEVTLQKRAGR